MHDMAQMIFDTFYTYIPDSGHRTLWSSMNSVEKKLNTVIASNEIMFVSRN